MDNIDSAAVQGLPSEFNSIFVETNHHQLVNNETIHMPNLIQQNETGLIDMIPNNIQERQDQAERGSSCGSSTDDQQAPESDEVISSGEGTENVTASVFTNASSPTISDPDLPPQNGPNMPPLRTSSSFADDNPSMSKSEDNESELGQPQNQNLGLINHAQDDNRGEISSGTAVVNAPNMQPLRTISSGSPAVAGAPQHYPPTLMDYRHPVLRSLAGSNWSNSASPNQNLIIQPTLSSFQLRSQNGTLGINSPNATDIPRSSSSFFNGNSLPVVTMGMSTAQQESVVLQPFRQEDVHQPNLMYPFFAFSENVPPVLLEQYLPVSRSMGAIGQYGTNNVQPSHIMTNNNFMDSNISQQPSLLPNSFPQNTMIGTGVANQNSQLVNPQQAMFAPFGMLNAAYNLPNTSAGSWPQYLPTQPQQFGQVPPMANIAFDTNILEYSSPLGPQNLSYFYTNNQPSNIAPAAHDQSLLHNPILPEVSFNSRPPYFSYPRQQPNEVQPATNTSVIPDQSNAMSSRISPTSDAGAQQVNQSPVTPNMTGPQEYSKNSVTATSATPTSSGPSSLSRLSNGTNQREPQTLANVVERHRASRIPKPSILTRSRARSQQNNDLLSAVVANNPDPIESLMKRLAQSTEKGFPKEMSTGTSVKGTILPGHSQILNSQAEQNNLNHQQEGGILNTGVPNIPDQFVTSPMKELGEVIHGLGGRTFRAPKRLGIGESMSMLSKRVRRDNQEAVGKESESVAADFVTQNGIKFGIPRFEENNEADRANVSSQPNNNSRRIITNGVYDPKYEDMGLPIDPHLRVFASLNQKKWNR